MTKFKNKVIGYNTPENVEYLKELGRKHWDFNQETEPLIFADCGEGDFWFENDNDGDILEWFPDSIDCRGNFPLFREKTAERREE